jgi:putative transposase
MPRHARIAPGGLVYHVLNRAVARLPLFQKDGDYAAFERVMAEALLLHPMRVLAYCVMPNHWHLVLWPLPGGTGDLGRFMQRLTVRHVRRWREHRHRVGWGHVYQGTYKSFPVQDDEHYLRVCRYVERNALRSGLVARAEDWR